MPLYEYHCNQCHVDFEVRRSFSDTGTPVCPVCHDSAHVTRKFSAPAIVFKGSGFYVTDSRGKNAAGAPAKRASSNGNGANSNSEVTTPSGSTTEKAKTSSD
ncbi:MAG TPA: zinc ribbon domain-containing protein [Anaerolineae bacterium]|nr:zinc ribbon domain-containing protein [Anaerolineae bacterium]